MSGWPSCCRWSATPHGMPTAISSNRPADESAPATVRNSIMGETAQRIGGGVVSLIGIVGLFLSANALDRGIHVFGLALALFAVTYVLALIHHAFDERDARITAATSASRVV